MSRYDFAVARKAAALARSIQRPGLLLQPRCARNTAKA